MRGQNLRTSLEIRENSSFLPFRFFFLLRGGGAEGKGWRLLQWHIKQTSGKQFNQHTCQSSMYPFNTLFKQLAQARQEDISLCGWGGRGEGGLGIAFCKCLFAKGQTTNKAIQYLFSSLLFHTPGDELQEL